MFPVLDRANFRREGSQVVDQLWNQPIIDSGEPDQIALRDSSSAGLERLLYIFVVIVIHNGAHDITDSPDGAMPGPSASYYRPGMAGLL
jgi:hypothetical protein